jgi:hypothetical protein
VRLASHQAGAAPDNLPPPPPASPESLGPGPVERFETLEDLEVWAIANNPTLRRMQQEAAAEWAKTGYVSKLPDPTISSMFYLPPMNYDPDRLVAELQVMQMIPWVGRLQAEARQAHLEALAAENAYLAERLRMVAEVRMNWFRLYVLGKQIATTEADQAQLESLIKTANARVATGDAQPGDVLMGTLELSSLQEQLLTYRQELESTAAELNRLVGRDARVPITPPNSLDVEFPSWDHDLLRTIATSAQPELNAARLRTAATRWGIDVARLKQRPDVSLSGRRIRPCLMTAFTTFAALLPVMLATGRGADVARAMALPVFFGMFVELVSLFVVPVLYCGYMEARLILSPSATLPRLEAGRA